MTLITFFEFETHNEGVTTMNNFDYPCAFIVDNEIFDYQGNPLNYVGEYFISPNESMSLIIGFGDENTTEDLTYVQDNICKVNKAW
jgi:hypothetical protein